MDTILDWTHDEQGNWMDMFGNPVTPYGRAYAYRKFVESEGLTIGAHVRLLQSSLAMVTGIITQPNSEFFVRAFHIEFDPDTIPDSHAQLKELPRAYVTREWFEVIQD